MFSLNLNGILVLTMFKKSYFLECCRPSLTALTAVPLTSQQSLENKHMLLRQRLLRLQTTYMTVVYTNIKIFEFFLDIFFLAENNYLSTLTFVICRHPVT